MIRFSTTILKFSEQGEKTGWTYILLKAELAEKLIPGNKKTFRAKGFLDSYHFEQTALLPMGGGDFILPLNAKTRKAIGKAKGAKVDVQIEVDAKPLVPPAELIECLKDEPKALEQFNSLAKSHQNYYTKWIESAKTDETKAKRIAKVITAMVLKQDFGTMIRSMKEERDKLMS
jgi:hypothetical protein